ncbi:hypothetical protein K461DRAFT_290295 [Myriangium duriaei CBS 260.36]|uniref:JmjC domain-containing protein n=1 Tax=Myriangium duriaei CBS 260.36 TaxID=1168546 RepID=A0A9P4MM89_9PEZI|nr:hypothetical protein K461DRAFT_290295 [Myriangium duriaei CBS 260.36]
MPHEEVLDQIIDGLLHMVNATDEHCTGIQCAIQSLQDLRARASSLSFTEGSTSAGFGDNLGGADNAATNKLDLAIGNKTRADDADTDFGVDGSDCASWPTADQADPSVNGCWLSVPRPWNALDCTSVDASHSGCKAVEGPLGLASTEARDDIDLQAIEGEVFSPGNNDTLVARAKSSSSGGEPQRKLPYRQSKTPKNQTENQGSVTTRFGKKKVCQQKACQPSRNREQRSFENEQDENPSLIIRSIFGLSGKAKAMVFPVISRARTEAIQYLENLRLQEDTHTFKLFYAICQAIGNFHDTFNQLLGSINATRHMKQGVALTNPVIVMFPKRDRAACCHMYLDKVTKSEAVSDMASMYRFLYLKRLAEISEELLDDLYDPTTSLCRWADKHRPDRGKYKDRELCLDFLADTHPSHSSGLAKLASIKQRIQRQFQQANIVSLISHELGAGVLLVLGNKLDLANLHAVSGEELQRLMRLFYLIYPEFTKFTQQLCKTITSQLASRTETSILGLTADFENHYDLLKHFDQTSLRVQELSGMLEITNLEEPERLHATRDRALQTPDLEYTRDVYDDLMLRIHDHLEPCRSRTSAQETARNCLDTHGIHRLYRDADDSPEKTASTSQYDIIVPCCLESFVQDLSEFPVLLVPAVSGIVKPPGLDFRDVVGLLDYGTRQKISVVDSNTKPPESATILKSPTFFANVFCDFVKSVKLQDTLKRFSYNFLGLKAKDPFPRPPALEEFDLLQFLLNKIQWHERKDTTEFGITEADVDSFTRSWFIAGTTGAASPWHTDTSGFCTIIHMAKGEKHWFWRRTTSSIERITGVSLREADWLIQAPGISHAVYSTTNCLARGYHFWHTHMLHLSIAAITDQILNRTQENETITPGHFRLLAFIFKHIWDLYLPAEVHEKLDLAIRDLVEELQALSGTDVPLEDHPRLATMHDHSASEEVPATGLPACFPLWTRKVAQQDIAHHAADDGMPQEKHGGYYFAMVGFVDAALVYCKKGVEVRASMDQRGKELDALWRKRGKRRLRERGETGSTRSSERVRKKRKA